MENRPADIVEQHLRSQYANNSHREIWPGNNAVIERLLQDRRNLCGAWEELFKACPVGDLALLHRAEQWQMVVDTVVNVAAGWSPEKTRKTRQAIKDVSDLTQEIQSKALELAELLRKRDRLCDTSAVSKTPLDCQPIDLLGPAARIADRHPFPYENTHVRFNGFIEAELKGLTDRFDPKYWPRTADLIEAIAEAQDHADFLVDELSESALEVRQASTRDFMRALDKGLNDLSFFGIKFKFSHAGYAAIVNAACGLNQTESAETVKKYRSDERKRAG